MSRPDELADAAVTVLAANGLKGLTHRAVDAQAGLPQGSTSNCFRTRAELVAAVVRRLEHLDRESLTLIGPPDTSSLSAFTSDLARRTLAMSQPPHDRSMRARLGLISSRVDLRVPHTRFLRLLEEALELLGIADAPAAARMVSDQLEGALVHSVTARPIDADELAGALLRLLAPDVPQASRR